MPLDMNPEVRARWCAALRSGEYKQSGGYLRSVAGYCCLGVLCDLAVKAKVIPPPADWAGHWRFDGDNHFLPGSVVTWAGLAAIDPAAGTDGSREYLSKANDDGCTFAEIADLIDGGTS
jgi:hypothetical protein